MPKYVKLSELLPCPYNREVDEAKVADIKDAVIQTGEIKPFVVTEVKTDEGERLMITDGHHRHLALLDLAHHGPSQFDLNMKVPVVMADERGVETASQEKPTEVKKELMAEEVICPPSGSERLEPPSVRPKKPSNTTKASLEILRDALGKINRVYAFKKQEVAVEGLGMAREDLGVRRGPKPNRRLPGSNS